MQAPIQYKDKWLRLVGIPLMIALMMHVGLGWEELVRYVQTQDYWINLCYISGMVVLTWHLLRWGIIWLDKRVPYFPRLGYRITVQLGLFVPTILAITLLGNHLYVRVLKQMTHAENYWTTDVPISALLLVFLNLLYIGLVLFQHSSTPTPVSTPPPRPTATSAPSLSFSGKWRNQTRLVEPQQILLVESKDRLTYAYTTDEKRVLLTPSLQQVFAELPETDFFLANRQYIVSRKIVQGFQRTATRKLRLQLTNPVRFEEEVTVSKARAAAFQSWLSV